LVLNSEISSVNDFSVTTYELIRTINIAINGIEKGSLDEEDKQLLLGQAYFFRAWCYWELVKLYGGVPMILIPQDPFYDNLDVPRSTTKECIELIVADLDAAISGLPAFWTLSDDMGRITSVAAAAFKGRLLLAWASPMFNTGNDPNRWNQAYNANLLARELADEVGYGLNPSFENIFTDNPNENDEAILFRTYNGTPEFSSSWESSIWL
jgi:hypothetical protein